MIDELREAFDLAAQQSEQEQAAIAARIKEMIEADRQWYALLSDPDSLSMLEEMAEEAHQEYLRGEAEEIEPEVGRTGE
jgi:hypothetical protein